MWDISICWGGPLGGLPCIEIPALKKWLRIPWIGPGEKQGDGKWLGEGVVKNRVAYNWIVGPLLFSVKLSGPSETPEIQGLLVHPLVI